MARTYLERNMLETLRSIEAILALPHLREARKRLGPQRELDERIAEIEREMGIPETVEA